MSNHRSIRLFLTFPRWCLTNFELQGVYCWTGGDVLLFDEEVCVVSQGEMRLAIEDDHD